jgi:hypothetical protein
MGFRAGRGALGVLGATVTTGIVIAGGSAAAAATGHVQPGARVTVSSNSCEVGFLLRHRKAVYAAIPASCLGTDGGDGANGCGESQAPRGTPATIAGASRRAHVVYSSFTHMQRSGSRSTNPCTGNNLALLRLAKPDARRARGEIPGPLSLTGVAHSAPASGSTLGVYLASATSGRAGSTDSAGWRQEVTVEGMVAASNLGAPAVTSGGRAVGMIAAIPPLTGVGASEVTSLAKELRYVRGVHAFRHVRLMTR